MSTLSLKVLIIIALVSASSVSYSDDHNDKKMADNTQITNAWARATFALAKTGAAYMEIENTSKQLVRLVSVSVSEEIASTAELHHTIMIKDMMQMQQLEDGIVLAAGEKVSFVPGGKHIMLMGLTGPLNKDESVDIKLDFSDGSSIIHTFEILDKRVSSDALHKHH